jgi:hypothetical protein
MRTASGASAWMSAALGELAVSTPALEAVELPSASELAVGQSYAIDGILFHVASLTRARYAGVEGELPFESWDRHEALFADLDTEGKDAELRFATIDYSDTPPAVYVGTYVELDDLAPRNLRRFEGW